MTWWCPICKAPHTTTHLVKVVVTWLAFWWLPLTSIHWDGRRWVQGREEIPEYLLTTFGFWALVFEGVFLVAVAVAIMIG